MKKLISICLLGMLVIPALGFGFSFFGSKTTSKTDTTSTTTTSKTTTSTPAAPAKPSFADQLKAKAAAAVDAAKKAAAAAADKAKKAAADVAAKAKAAGSAALASAKQKALLLAAIGKKALEQLKTLPAVFGERMKTLSLNDQELNLTFPIKIDTAQPATSASDGKTVQPQESLPAGQPQVITIGIKYQLFPGYGDITTGFEHIPGVFYPDTLPGPVPLPSSLVIEPLKAAPVVGDLLNKVMSLSPQMVFLLKVIAVGNDAKKLPAADAVGFVATNLNFLLARLAQTPEIKGIVDLLKVLPDALRTVFTDLLNKIELPLDDQDVQAYNDRRGKPPSDMQKAVSLVRWSLGYSARLALAREKILPLITPDLSLSDKNLLLYFLKRSVYDLDKGFETDDPPDGVSQVIKLRVDDMTSFLETVSERIEQAHFAADYEAAVASLQDEVKKVQSTQKVDMPKPFFGGLTKTKVPLTTYLDVKFYEITNNVLQRKFEEDGDFNEGSGPYLFDDSFLNEDQAKEYMMAVLFRCAREKSNEQFDMVSFLKNELSSFLYVRIEESYRQKLLNLIAPFVNIFQSIASVAAAAQSAAVGVAGQLGAGGMAQGMSDQATGMASGMLGMAKQMAQDAIDEANDSLLDDRDFQLLGLEDPDNPDTSGDGTSDGIPADTSDDVTGGLTDLTMTGTTDQTADAQPAEDEQPE